MIHSKTSRAEHFIVKRCISHSLKNLAHLESPRRLEANLYTIFKEKPGCTIFKSEEIGEVELTETS